MQGLKPVTMSDLIKKAQEASNENLLIVLSLPMLRASALY